MKSSETIGTLAAALAKAQGEFGPLRKGATNPFFKSSYADLAQVMDVARTPLVENDLAITQTHAESESGYVLIETTLMHSSGEWISGIIKMPLTKADPQGYGSATTYARRYALQAILGLAAEDDDGNAATHTNDKDEAKKHKEPAPEPEQHDGIITMDLVPTAITMQQGENKKTGKTWTRYTIQSGNDKFTTFSESFAKLAKEAKEAGWPVRITYKKGEFGNDIQQVTAIHREPGSNLAEEG